MFKIVDDKMIVDCPILEIYLPVDYKDKDLYYMKGSLVEFYGVCNMKAFKSEAEMERRNFIDAIPVGIPMMINSNPTDIEMGMVKLNSKAAMRKWIILRYYKGDELMTNTACISSSDNVGALMRMLENGKLDFVPIRYVRDILDRAEQLNGVNLRMSSEAKDAMIIECYRDPDDITKKLRFAKNQDDAVAVNSREEAMLGSTYQAFTFEDINSSLIASVNRARAGVEEEPTVMEQIVRGGRPVPTVKSDAETSV